MSDAGTPGADALSLAEGVEFAAALDALRNRGAHEVDPVRFRFIESLARRAAAHEGAARRVLDDKVARLLAAYGDGVDAARSAQPDTGHPVDEGLVRRRPLAELVAQVARPVSPRAADHSTHAEDVSPARGAAAEPVALQYFRRTWSRLSTAQRLAQSRSALPENAGPLHSHHLVHRSLALMCELAPEYLDRFVAQVDALLWLESAHGGDTR